MDILIIVLLLAIAAEVTYLTAQSRRKNRPMSQSPVFVDTSVLIDGRITAIAKSGFISRPLYIPRSVVGELQYLADNGDSEKRTRARHGLDVINQLQSISEVEVVIFADGVRAEEGVDNRLLELAIQHNGALCTIDYNLNKVAVVQGIQVWNVNELAKTLRMAYLPGEKIKLELSQKGNDNHQAVGHLPDGTMVVVEHAYKLIGSVVEVEFIRALQTAAGKMMFAKVVGSVQGSKTEVRKASRQKSEDKPALSVKAEKPQKRGTKPVEATEKPKPARRTNSASSTRQKQKDSASTEKSQQKKQEQREQQPRPRPAGQQRRNRRKTPEESLVELANS